MMNSMAYSDVNIIDEGQSYNAVPVINGIRVATVMMKRKTINLSGTPTLVVESDVAGGIRGIWFVCTVPQHRKQVSIAQIVIFD
jgi:hypothetical protein